jgi:hypothetical protein
MRVLSSPILDTPEAPTECYPTVEVECSIQVDDTEISSVLVDGKRLVVTRKLPPKEIVLWTCDGKSMLGYSADQLST